MAPTIQSEFDDQPVDLRLCPRCGSPTVIVHMGAADCADIGHILEREAHCRYCKAEFRDRYVFSERLPSNEPECDRQPL
jgi:C4-type Zn-finger protein